MTKRLLLLVVLALAACGATPDYRPKEPLSDRRPPPAVTKAAGGPEPAKPGALKRRRRPISAPTEMRLSNGIRVLFLETHEFPDATLGFIIDRGAAAAPPGVAELFMEGMLVGANKSASARDNRNQLDWLGAKLNAHTSQDAVTLSVEAISALMPQILPHVCAMATTPLFDEESLGEARATARRATLHAHEDPDTVSDVALRALLFPERHPYSVVPWTAPAARFTSMSRNEIENFRDMYLAADRLTVAVVGDLKPAMVMPGLERCLARLPRKKGADAPPVPPAPAPAKSRIVLVPRPGASQANISLGFMGVRRSDPTFAPLMVLESILGRSLSGRLNLAIRAEHGYSYGVHMRTRAWRDGGLVEVTTSANTAHAVETVKGLLSELSRVQSQSIPPAEIDRAKLHTAARAIADADEVRSAGLSLLASHGLSLRHYEELAESIEKLTEADLQAAASKTFGTSVQIAVVGDPSLEAPLRALGLGEVTVRRE